MAGSVAISDRRQHPNESGSARLESNAPMNVMKTLAYAFGAAGLLAVVGCAFVIFSAITFQRHALRAPAQVVDMQVTDEYRKSTDTTPSGYQKMYAPIVEFEAAGGKQRVVSRVRSNTRDYRVGQRVNVLYLEADPTHALIDGFWERWLGVVLFAPFALVFGGIGAGFGIYFWRRHRMIRWLQRFGMRVRVACSGAELDTSISAGDKHPWRVTCEWQDATTMKTYRMHSDPLWKDPRPQVTGQMLDVLVNSANPRQYRIDVDYLA